MHAGRAEDVMGEVFWWRNEFGGSILGRASGVFDFSIGEELFLYFLAMWCVTRNGFSHCSRML